MLTLVIVFQSSFEVLEVIIQTYELNRKLYNLESYLPSFNLNVNNRIIVLYLNYYSRTPDEMSTWCKYTNFNN